MKTNLYIISLSPQSPRASALANRLQAQNTSFEFVDAVDGRKFDLDTYQPYDKRHARLYMGRDLVGGEIGCYLSHLKAADAFLSSDADLAIVLEDDAAPSAGLLSAASEIAAHLSRIDPEWLIVNIGKSSDKLNSDITAILNGANLLQAAHYFPVTTHGLLWSRRGAEAFIREHDKIWAPVDNYFRHWLTRAGHGYAVHPPLVDVTGAESLIAPEQTGSKRQKNGRTWHFQLSKQKRLLTDKLIAKSKQKAFSRVQPAPSVSPAE
jgi:glycosyl transferase family 25